MDEGLLDGIVRSMAKGFYHMKRFSILLILLASFAQAQVEVTMKKTGKVQKYVSVEVEGLTLKVQAKNSKFKRSIKKRDIKYISVPKPADFKTIEQAYYSRDHKKVVSLAKPFIDKYKYLGWGKAVVPYYVDSLMVTKAESSKIAQEAQLGSAYLSRSERAERIENVLLKIAQVKSKALTFDYETAIESLIELKLPSKFLASYYYIALGDLYLGQGNKQQAATQYMKVLVVDDNVGAPQWNLAYFKAESLFEEINPNKVKQLQKLKKIKLAE